MLKKTAAPSLLLPAEQAVQARLSDEEDKLRAPGDGAAGDAPGTSRGVAERTAATVDSSFQMKSEKSKQKQKQHLQRFNFYELCNQYLSRHVAHLVKTYNFLRLNDKDDRCSAAFKQFCWRLYFASPKTYRLFEKILGLPHINKLKKTCTPISTRITDDFLIVLKAKVDNMTEREKNCSLIVSVVDVKPRLCYHPGRDELVGLQEVDGVQSPSPARRALVVALRGLLVDWTQPVVFVLLADCESYGNISTWIQKIMSALLDVGFNIRAIVSRLDTELTRATRRAGVTVDEPFFFARERKIYHIVDTSYLTRQVCSCFKMFDFQFAGDRVAKFDHVRKFYDLDKTRAVRLAGELIDEHMEPLSAEETGARHAALVLSARVAAGVAAFADFDLIDRSAKDTVNFLLLMSDFIDCLKKFCGKTAQLELLHRVRTAFWSLKALDPQNGTDVTKIIDFVEGLQISIRSIILLREDLAGEGYGDAVLTRYINNDTVEAFFNKTRTAAGAEPTCRRLASALRKFYATCVLKPIRCNNNDVEMVNFIEEIYEISIRSGIGATQSIFDAPSRPDRFVEIARSDYDRFSLPENNSLLYICGCLLKKCHDRHRGCDLMDNYMNASETSLTSPRYRRYAEFATKSSRALPAAPPDEFVEHVVKLERVFSEAFGSTHLVAAFGASVLDRLAHVSFAAPPCPCFPTAYLHKLFVRTRIYSTVKFNNRTLRAEDNIKREY